MSEAGRGERPAGATPDEKEDGPAMHLVPELPEPLELNLFVGRDDLLAEAAELLRVSRLVALVGVGGVGKSRVLMHLAEQAAASGEFVDGVTVVRLTDLREGDDLIESHILDKLRILDNAEGPGLARLIEHYSRRRALLMLDNCEQLVGDNLDGPLPRMVRTLLQGTKYLKIVATSRDRRPWMRDQKILDVPPLQIQDAVQLLIARTRDVGVRSFGQPHPSPALPPEGERRAQRRIGQDEHTLATELCSMLDRLPLAIELAAGRLDIRTPQSIVSARNKLAVLTDGASEQGHHTTMRAAIGWSYDGLKDQRARRVWELVAVCEGGFDLAAAQAICAGHGVEVEEVEDLLSALVRRSVLVAEPSESGMRYQMLELIRQYGLERLAAAGETAAIRTAHAGYFAELTATAAGTWFGPEEPRWLRRLQVEEANSRAAHLHLVSTPDTLLAGMTLGNNRTSTRTDVYAGKLNSMRRMLALGLTKHPAAASPEQITSLSLSAWVAYIQGNQALAQPLLEQAESAALQLGCQESFGPLLYTRATRLWLAEDDLERSRECLELFRRAGVALAAGGAPAGVRFMNDLFAAMATVFLGTSEQALAASAALLADANAAGAQWCISWALWTCALAKLLYGSVVEAATLAQRALRIQLEIGDTWGPAWSRWLLALIAMALGQIELGAQILGGAHKTQRITQSNVEGLASFWRLQQQRVAAAIREFGDHPFRNQVAVGASLDVEQIDELARRPMTQRRPALASLLTPRELEVIRLLAAHRRIKDIADALTISYRTVETHMQNIMQKLGLPSRDDLMAWLAREGVETAAEESA